METYSQSLKHAIRFLKANNHFLVVNHVNPDGDATGSLLAVGCLLKRWGKDFVLVNEGKTPARFSFLPLFDQIRDLSRDPLTGSFDHVIAVDSADRERMGSVRDYIADGANLLNIDHHPTNDRYGTINVVREDAASTTEVLYDLVKSAGEPFDQDLATCLYTGLLTDTGGFRYSNTTANVMRVAAELLQHQVSPAKIAERCLETRSEAYMKLLQLSLQSLEIMEEGKLATISVRLKDMEKSGASREDADGLVNYPRNIEKVEVGICFKELEDQKVKVSFRSREYIDVSQIAREFGGGGHVRASGCTMEGTLDEVKDRVIKRVITELQQKK
ncbi:MAG: bifunctional oligoribonuclease/PAP phosphatase NrnA [Bacillaceae bacterium]|nr:bifunctional oligoribonuclease/PAP phosphatase NrnA [Bacillaceae bacterium]